MDNSITITLEEYVDLIRAQHTVEVLIAARENYTLAFKDGGTMLFDAIVGKINYAQKD